jgi:long-chain acyl-CoA synthetase
VGAKVEVYKLISAEIKAVNRNMPPYKHIYQFTIRENELAKTTTRKIKRYIEKTG